MRYTVVSVSLKNGPNFDQAIIASCCLSRVRGLRDVPFTEEDIIAITANHEKWAWNEAP